MFLRKVHSRIHIYNKKKYVYTVITGYILQVIPSEI